MPQLLLVPTLDGWRARVANTAIDYGFSGGTTAQQFLQVRAMQQAMLAGPEQLSADAANFLVVPEGTEPAWAITELFEATELFFQGELVFAAREGVTLFDELVTAALRLGEFL